jgi:RND family efflux transporter MFP subunit
MKNFVIVLLATLMASCAGTESPEAIRSKISALKDQSLEINHQIKELEKQLVTLESDELTSNNVPVQVKLIAEERFEHFFVVNAKVELLEEAQISPEGTGGQIRKIHVSKGQRVSKGDLLISLNSSILENGIAELKLGLELATKIYEKQKSLWEQNIGSEMQYLEAKNGKEGLEHKLKTLQSQLDMALIKAPFSGIVDEIYLKEGEMASPGRSILYLVNLDKLKVLADVSETLLPKIKVGDMVNVKFPSYANMEMKAPINRISNSIDLKTRTIKVEVRLDNVNSQIKPNQIAMLSIMDFETPKAIVLPSLIIKQDSRGEFLFVAEKNEAGAVAAKKIYVQSGLSHNDQTMVLKGLTIGQQVITAGYNQVGNGSLVEVRE